MRKVHVSDTQLVDELLKPVQQGCRSRLLTGLDVAKACRDLDRRLSILPKEMRYGVVAFINPWFNPRRSNNYPPVGTRVMVEYTRNGWVVTDAIRGYGASESPRLRLKRDVSDDLVRILKYNGFIMEFSG